MNDLLRIDNKQLTSRLFLGSGKFTSYAQMTNAIISSGTQVVTVALRRVDLQSQADNILSHIPEDIILLPNTSGARNSEEAIRIARMARACGMGDWIKIEVIADQKYLLPDNAETIKATEALVKEGFVVLPYMNPDLMVAKHLEEVGAAAVMPLGAPIGTNRGLETIEMIKIMIEEANVPIIVDAGIGKPSQAAQAMELGAAAVLVNTAIATADSPILMAKAFAHAVQAGRKGYIAGLGPISSSAHASSPLTGFLTETS